jgi:hypothetical protein
MTPESGCRRCVAGRDAITGWGRLNVEAAVNYFGRLAAVDWNEPNDDAGARSFRVRKQTKVINASLDYWNDPSDVYAIRLRRGGRVVATLSRMSGASLVLWRPGTRSVTETRSLTNVVSQSVGFGKLRVVRFGVERRVRRAGLYYLQVTMPQPGTTSYTLRIVRR